MCEDSSDGKTRLERVLDMNPNHVHEAHWNSPHGPKATPCHDIAVGEDYVTLYPVDEDLEPMDIASTVRRDLLISVDHIHIDDYTHPENREQDDNWEPEIPEIPDDTPDSFH